MAGVSALLRFNLVPTGNPVAERYRPSGRGGLVVEHDQLLPLSVFPCANTDGQSRSLIRNWAVETFVWRDLSAARKNSAKSTAIAMWTRPGNPEIPGETTYGGSNA